MSLNLKSISLLTNLPTKITVDSKQLNTLSNIGLANDIDAAYADILASNDSANDTDKGFHPLSVNNKLSIEVSDGSTSYKICLSSLIKPMFDSFIWLRKNAAGYVTQSQLSAYVPWNLAGNDLMISGGALSIVGADSSETGGTTNALVVCNNIEVLDSSHAIKLEINSSSGNLRTNGLLSSTLLTVANVLSTYDKNTNDGYNYHDSIKIANLSATTANLLTIINSKLTANSTGVIAEKLSAKDVLSTNSDVCCGGSLCATNAVITNDIAVNRAIINTGLSVTDILSTGVDTRTLSAMNLSVDSSFIVKDYLSAEANNIVSAKYLSSTDLRADNLSIDNKLSAVKNGTSEYKVKADSTKFTANAVSVDTLCAVALSAGLYSTTVGTTLTPMANLCVNGDATIEVLNLYSHALSAGKDMFVKIPDDKTTLSVVNISSTNLIVEEDLKAGIYEENSREYNNLHVNGGNLITILKLDAVNLSSTGSYAHLTAEAACWS